MNLAAALSGLTYWSLESVLGVLRPANRLLCPPSSPHSLSTHSDSPAMMIVPPHPHPTPSFSCSPGLQSLLGFLTIRSRSRVMCRFTQETQIFYALLLTELTLKTFFVIFKSLLLTFQDIINKNSLTKLLTSKLCFSKILGK